MSTEAFFALLGTLLLHTSALVWWGATLTSTVKHHEEKLLDHETRLRKAQI